MPPDGWFRRKSKFAPAPAAHSAAQVPEGVATKCARCGEIIFTKDFEKNLKVCSVCGFHHKLTAEERIAYTADEGSWSELAANLRSTDPLHFEEYPGKLAKSIKTTGLADGVVIGTAAVQGLPLVLGVTDFRFMGGSMGSVAGEKIVRAMEEGIARRLPVVLFTASGGARMQEGLLSLMQMAKTSAAAARLAEAKLPYIVVMTDATMAGVLASYASLGDIHLAEPGATIGFAGARVVAQATVQKPPEDYQTSEWQLAHGHIDAVVARRDLPQMLATLLMLLSGRSADVPTHAPSPSRNGTNGALALSGAEAVHG
ncbi:MAG: acetyl-CoA carboxylase, carboxyltransferase subunit beta [Armatimonadota bacterium]|nr:acetyl-CoA carboxylase, carboxyltransferase subunit beta [Armatimonadota bacterium]